MMKKFTAFVILVVFIFEHSFPSCAAFAANTNYKSNFDKYNLTDKECEFIGRITQQYRNNIPLTEELIQKGLLDDFMNSQMGRGQVSDQIEIFMILRNQAGDFSKKRLKIVKSEAKDYFIKIDDTYYKGLSKIDLAQIPQNAKIFIGYDNYYTLKTIKKRQYFETNYDLTKDEKKWLEQDTNYYKTNLKLIKQILDDSYYDEYCKYCHTPSVYGESKKIKKAFLYLPKLIEAGNFSEAEIKNLACKRFNADIIQLDDKYYKNLKKVDLQTLKNAKEHSYYDKKRYKSIKKIKQYKAFQTEYNLNKRTMERVWADSVRLNKNKKLIKKALSDGTYEDYGNYKNADKHFADNYKTYLILKQNDILTQKEKKHILSNYGTPCISLNPKYWGNKTKKVKAVLKNKRVKNSDKFNEMDEKISYRRPYSDEWISDIATRLFIGSLLLSGIGTIGGIMAWAAYSDSGGEFIKFKF